MKVPSDATSIKARSYWRPLRVIKADDTLMPLHDLIGYMKRPLMRGFRWKNMSDWRKTCVSAIDNPKATAPVQLVDELMIRVDFMWNEAG